MEEAELLFVTESQFAGGERLPRFSGPVMEMMFTNSGAGESLHRRREAVYKALPVCTALGAHRLTESHMSPSGYG